MSDLRQASFRGVPFAVTTNTARFGRRQAVHEYPFRDKPWIEDLGRGTRRFSINGFLITDSLVYGGGDVVDQRDRLIAAVEQSGPGKLVHPTLGELTVSVETVAITESWQNGRSFDIVLNVIEAGEKIFPSTATDTSAKVATSAAAADTAAAGDFAGNAVPVLGTGAAVLTHAQAAVGSWSATIANLGQDATSLFRLGSRLVGSYGRYFNDRNLGGFGVGLLNAALGATTIADLVPVAAAARATLGAALAFEASVLGELGVSASGPTDYAAAAQASTAALLATAANPADGLRLLEQLAGYAAPDVSPIGGFIGDVHRRAAAVALARAASAYQPWSYDDAAAVRTAVTTVLDAEILAAGDQGDDASFSALRDLRVAAVQDLAARGANLARVILVTLPAPQPALVLAQRLYGDAGRADELVTAADPVSPLFMPTNFRALAA